MTLHVVHVLHQSEDAISLIRVRGALSSKSRTSSLRVVSFVGSRIIIIMPRPTIDNIIIINCPRQASFDKGIDNPWSDVGLVVHIEAGSRPESTRSDCSWVLNGQLNSVDHTVDCCSLSMPCHVRGLGPCGQMREPRFLYLRKYAGSNITTPAAA